MRTTLRPKQPLALRYRRVELNRRARVRRRRSDHVAHQEEASAELGMASEMRALLQQQFRKTQHGGTSLQPDSQALRAHRVKDVIAVRRVFEAYDWDGSGALDQAELKGLLADLGLRARNPAEREQIQFILRSVSSLEVSFEDLVEWIIPKVRFVLAEVNREVLREYFEKADIDCSNSLTINELVKVVRLMGIFPSQAAVEAAVLEVVPDASQGLRTIDGDLLLTRNIVSFEQFLHLAALLQERVEFGRAEKARAIARAHNLTKEERDLWGQDVVDLHESFRRFCHGGPELAEVAKLLDTAKLGVVVRDSGVLRTSGALQKRLSNLLRRHADGASDGCLTFKQLLEVLSVARRQEQAGSRQVFESHCGSSGGGLSLLTSQRALRDCDVVPRSDGEAQEIAFLIEEFDEDGSGEVELGEFERLALFVAERLRKLRREAERLRVFQHDWTEEQYKEFRTAFVIADEDFCEALTEEQLGKAVEQLQRGWTSKEGVNALAELGADPSKGVDFLTFLDLMKAMSDGEEHRQIALQAGIDREMADLLCAEWRRLKPSKDGMMPRRRMKHLVGMGNQPDAELTFPGFIQLVQGMTGMSSEKAARRGTGLARLKSAMQ